MNVQAANIIPPHSAAAEAFVLGSMMIDKAACDTAIEILVAGDFYVLSHGVVFDCCRALYLAGKAVDVVVVASELERQNNLTQIAGAQTLTDMVCGVSTPAYAAHHAQTVKNYAILRELHRCSVEIAKDCMEHEDEPQAILERAEKFVFAISERGTTSKLEPLSAFAHEALEGVERVFKKQAKVTGLETGFPRLDRMTSGFQPGNMVTLAARPGMGKSAMALEIARHVAVVKGIPVAFFSLEMSRAELFLRLLSLTTGIDHYRLRTGYFATPAWADITAATEKLSEAPLYLDDSTLNMSAVGIRSSSRRLAGKLARAGTPLGLVVVDYLQLIAGSTKYKNRESEVADISRNLKGLARDLHVPVLALSQLNRNTEEVGRGGMPRLSDLRESGAIEQDSDLVIFIYREAMYRKGATDEERGKTKIIMAKQRNGPTGELDFHFHKETMRFYEQETAENQEE